MSWILDLDLKSFFDNISHEKLVQLVENRIADPRILRLIQKWLKAGVMEDGVWTPQALLPNFQLPRLTPSVQLRRKSP